MNMRPKQFTLMLAAAVLLAGTASAQVGVTFVLTPAVQAGVASNEVVFTGILSNTSATANLFLNDIQISFGCAATNYLTGDTNTFYVNVPGILLPGETYSDVVFGVAINAGTPAGTYTGAVTVLCGTNIFDETTLSAQAAQVVVADTPFAAWQAAEFGTNASNPAISGDLADPDGDGIVNLLEYALYMDPNTASVTGLPTPQVDPGCGCLTLIYTKVISATDLTYTPEANGVLGGPWSTNGITQTILAGSGATLTIQASDTFYPLATSTNRFMHLKVTDAVIGRGAADLPRNSAASSSVGRVCRTEHIGCDWFLCGRLWTRMATPGAASGNRALCQGFCWPCKAGNLLISGI